MIMEVELDETFMRAVGRGRGPDMRAREPRVGLPKHTNENRLGRLKVL